MLEIIEMIFGTAEAVDDLLNGGRKKSSGKRNIPLWLRIIFFTLIYGSALLVGIAGGFTSFKESHIISAIAYWSFALCLIVFLAIVICKFITN